MVRFDREEDYMAAVTGGPWRLFGSILMVQAWTPEFNPLRDEIVTTPIWVRVSNLPVTFYHQLILMGIAGGLGRPVRVDMTTLNRERGRFARVCVEVDLKEPLKGTVLVNGERYFVSYEGLGHICPTCGIFGHLVSACPQKLSEAMAQMSTPDGRGVSGQGEQSNDGFTAVRRSGRRMESPVTPVIFAAGGQEKITERTNGVNARISRSGDIAISNSFSGLMEDSVEEIREVRGSQGIDKENANINVPQVLESLEKNKEGSNSKREFRVQKENKVADLGKRNVGPRSGKSSGPRKGPRTNMHVRD